MFYGNPTSTTTAYPASSTPFAFSARGDINSYTEHWAVYDENGIFLTTVGGSGSQCGSWSYAYYTASSNQMQSWLSDGTTFILHPSSGVDICSYNDVQVSFTLNGTYYHDSYYQTG